MKKSNVFFFIADHKVNILQAINKGEREKFKCCGTGNASFKKAMAQACTNEIVYQVKVSVNKTEVLYRY